MFTVVVVVTSLSISGAEPETLFVLADVARIRSAPAESGEVLGRARIGARLTVASRKGEWVEVSTPTGTKGFVAAASLDKERPTVGDLLRRASAARGSERTRWLERAAALDGTRRKTWMDLLTAYKREKRKDRVAFASSLLAGTMPVHLAVCYESNWLLLAGYVPGKWLERHVAEPSGETGNEENAAKSEAAEAEARRRAAELGSAAWFSNASGSFKPVPAEEIWGSVETMSTIDGAIHQVRLGSCDAPNAVAATVPLAPAGDLQGLAAFKPALASGAPKWRIAVRPRIEGGPMIEVEKEQPRERERSAAEGDEGEGEQTPEVAEQPPVDGQNGYSNAYDVEVEAGPARQKLEMVVDISGC